MEKLVPLDTTNPINSLSWLLKGPQGASLIHGKAGVIFTLIKRK